jgi:hypothetical protein
MTLRSPETSPQTYARAGGILYLFIIVAPSSRKPSSEAASSCPTTPTLPPARSWGICLPPSVLAGALLERHA